MKSFAKIKFEYLPDIKHMVIDGDIEEIQNDIQSTDFSKPGIHILNTHPGSGKSTAIKNKVKKLDKCLILVNSHKIAESEYNMRGLKQWKGFKHHEHDRKNAKNLYKLKVPIEIICDGCESEKKCDYHNQFKKNKVIAPFNYIDKKHVHERKDVNKPFRFKNLIVDEDILDTTELKLNKKEIIDSLDVIKKYTNHNYEIFISELDSLNWFKYEVEYFKDLKNSKFLANQKAVENYGKNKSVQDDIKKLNKLDPYKIRKFLHYREIYPGIEAYYEPNLYHIFDLARQNYPIVLSDATFNSDLFRILFSRYCWENEIKLRSLILPENDLIPLNDIEVTLYTTNLENKDFTINRMRKDNLYYESGFYKYKKKSKFLNEDGEAELNRFEKEIKLLKNFYDTISVISSEDLVNEIVIKKIHDNFSIEQYRNLKSLNTMENSAAILLYGTPPFAYGGEIENYNELFLTNFKETDFEMVRYFQRKGKWYDTRFKDEMKKMDDELEERLKNINDKTKKEQVKKNFEKWIGKTTYHKKIPFEINFKDKNFEKKMKRDRSKQEESGEIDAYLHYTPNDYLASKVEDLIYQALMRARIYRRNGHIPDIFMFCYVPDRVESEFNVVYYDYNETKEFFKHNFKGKYPLVLKTKIDSLKGDTKSIARELSLFTESGSLNTKFVTTMTNTEYDEIKKIDECIKKGLKKKTEFYNEYSSLKKFNEKSKEDKRIGEYDFNEFINDCIRYAKIEESSKFQSFKK